MLRRRWRIYGPCLTSVANWSHSECERMPWSNLRAYFAFDHFHDARNKRGEQSSECNRSDIKMCRCDAPVVLIRSCKELGLGGCCLRRRHYCLEMKRLVPTVVVELLQRLKCCLRLQRGFPQCFGPGFSAFLPERALSGLISHSMPCCTWFRVENKTSFKGALKYIYY
ncbi:hypothetical protein B0J12DRAFT_657855 [Macrophomina phaseolina]|uniref:Uncharacterized protein n=1 Tax=Macrophomina phaseolina TaxID=35725 RepID=A0ABQ8GG83_9PEZI|nr:hypothetical protein B0J12DRAFT_657855 [Macrophomina phaseolina]